MCIANIFLQSVLPLYFACDEFWCKDIWYFHVVKYYQFFTFGLSRSCLRNTSLPQDHKEILQYFHVKLQILPFIFNSLNISGDNFFIGMG